MSARIRKLLFCSALAMLAATAFPQAPRVAIYYYDRMPFFGRLGEADEGFLLRIARLVFEDAGIGYSFEKVPVNRIFENLKTTGLNCIAGTFKTPERERIYSFSRYPIYQDSPPHYLVRRTEKAAYAGIKTIANLLSSGKTLGVVKNYSYGTWVDANVERYSPNRDIVSISDDQASFFKMLAVGRFDFAFSSLEEANYTINKNPSLEGALSVLPLSDAPEGNIRWLMFARSFPADLLERLDDAIARVQRGAQYQAIIAGIRADLR